MRFKGLSCAPAVAIALGLAVQVQAAEVVLDAIGESATINGALFQITDIQPTGTGVIRPFVRLQQTQPNSFEQGYNTDFRPVQFDELTDPNFTRSLNLSTLQPVTINGTAYYQFLLDLHEPASASQNPISLDQVRIYLGSAPDLTGLNLTTNTFSSGSSTLIYNLDNGMDNWITLDGNLNPGSGAGDLFMNVPVSLFTGPNQWVYLYSRFGDHSTTEGTFEEWAAVIPLPAPALMVAAGMLMVAVRRKRRS